MSEDGINLYGTIDDLGSTVSSVAWSPDGKNLAASTDSGAVYIYEAEALELDSKFHDHSSSALEISWAPDASRLASCSLDGSIVVRKIGPGDQALSSGRPVILSTRNSGAVRSIAWAPLSEEIIAAGHDDGIIRLWTLNSNRCIRKLQNHKSRVRSLTWSPDESSLVSSSDDRSIQMWNMETRRHERSLHAHSLWVLSVRWSPDGKILASGSADSTLRLWDPSRGKLTDILEGHTKGISAITFSPDGLLLASKSLDGTLRIWKTDTWETISIIEEPTQPFPRAGLAFHPSKPILASLGEGNKVVRVWEYDAESLEEAAAESRAIHYTNAKVVIVGDSGVGKSGLALVLSGHDFEPTESTHGRHVWTLDSTETPLDDERTETRETLLWDLAGQPGYRLTHQLHLNEVAVAIVVLDTRSETDPFAGVKHWYRALKQVEGIDSKLGYPMAKFLVAARADRAGVALGKNEIKEMIDEMGFLDFFETSAKEGWGIAELLAAVKAAIQWESLPRVSSTRVFHDIKAFLIKERREERILATISDLYGIFQDEAEDFGEGIQDLSDEFATCVGRLESRGLVKFLSFGNLVLLHPEILDSYASAIVTEAKDEPHGSGLILEEDVLEARFKMPSDEKIIDREKEKLLLVSTVEELLRHEIALREDASSGPLLVFPSQFTTDWPEAPDPEGKAVIFRFEGSINNIYATLVVRLSRSGVFVRKALWRNAAEFKGGYGGTCGLWLREIEDGLAELTLFFETEPGTEDVKRTFEEYVYSHLLRRAAQGSVLREQLFICTGCSTPFTRLQIRKRKELGNSFIYCSVCDEQVSLKQPRRSRSSMVQRMEIAADENRDRDVSASVLKGKMIAGDYDVFLCHNSEDKEAVKDIGRELKSVGILPWLDEWEIRPGQAWQSALEEQISKVRSAAVFIGGGGLGPWERQEVDAFLREFVERKCAVIPVLLPYGKVRPDLPLFLKGLTWVDMRKKDPDPIKQLIWGIKGRRED